MTDTKHNILEEDLSELFGFADLSAEEKQTFLDDIGSTILESAVLRFMVEHDEGTSTLFQETIEANSENEEMLQVLITAFPKFGEMLEEEIAAFKEDAKRTLG